MPSTLSGPVEPALPYPPYFAVTCTWAEPWLIAAGTRPGYRHLAAGLPTDDAFLVTRCGPHVLLAVADGASDARAIRRGEGAQRAVATAAAHAQRSWPIYGNDVAQHGQLLHDAMAAAHVDLAGRARGQGLDANAFASTLTLALLTDTTITAAAIGDGSLYTWDRTTLHRFCARPLPQQGTPMITQPDWRSWFRTETSDRDYLQGLVVSTDGADDFFLETAVRGQGAVPSATIVKAMSDFCDQRGPTAAVAFAMQMLNDPEKARIAADDRTFIIAFKPQTSRARPYAPAASGMPR